MNQAMQSEIDQKMLFSEKKFSQIDPDSIPHHIAIIMDGNRRWAQLKNQPFEVGHWQGAEAIDEIIRSAGEIGIKVVTIYAFSTENWKRSKKEIDLLMQLFEAYLINRKEVLVKEGVRLRAIGNIDQLPDNVCKALGRVEEATSSCEKIELVLAVNYGGRDDIRRASLKLSRDLSAGKIKEEDVSEDVFAQYLDTAQWKDPDLLIRTSGERRLSNFLLWQLSYTEVIVMDVLWPDFKTEHLVEAIVQFQMRRRRLGE